MATLHLDFVAQDREVFSGEVTSIQAPGEDGQLGILPKHAPLMTTLKAGEVIVHREGAETLYFAVSGGWMEVRPDKITILARTAERSDEINVARAEAARIRAEQMLAQGVHREDRPRVRLLLERSRNRLRVSGRTASRPLRPDSTSDTQTRID